MTKRKLGHPSAPQRLSRESLHLAKEIRSIQHRAAEHDGRIVSLGPLVLFSTESGDAWILDAADALAARLAYAGDPMDIDIEETATSYTIGWHGHYRIDGEIFAYEDDASRQLVAIRGYPVPLLLRAISGAIHS